MGPDVGGTTGSTTETPTAQLAVAVYSLSSTQGPTTGGTVLEITGSGFMPEARVYFGDAEATEVHVTSVLRMGVVTPAGAEGLVEVRIENPDGGKGALQNGFSYYDASNAENPPPALVKLTPSSGPAKGGTVALAQGAGFLPGATFFVDWKSVKWSEVGSDTFASLITPPIDNGSVDVAITNPGGQSDVLKNGFNGVGEDEFPPGPQIHSVFPAISPVTGGTTIRITGQNLAQSSTLIMGGAPMKTWSVNLEGTEGTFETPAHGAGLVSLAVTNSDGQSALRPDAILFYFEAPVLYSVVPPAGPVEGGNTVTLNGGHFLEGMKVRIGGKPCAGLIIIAGDGAASEASTAQCTVPAGDAVGPALVEVENPDGLSGSLPGGYTYLSPNPSVTSVQPGSGDVAGGYVAAVIGVDFQPTSKVSFGGVAADVLGYSPQSLTVTVPEAAVSGAVTVEVTAEGYPSASLNDGFTYVEQGAPSIEAVTPESGPVAGGSLVVVVGANLRADSAVWFGPAAAFDVIAIGSDAITVMLPPAPAAGPVNVIIKTPGFPDAVLNNGFTFVAPDAPTITSVMPSTGPLAGGDVIGVQGTNLTPNSVVYFGAAAASNVLSNGPDGITLTLPAGSAKGPVDVVIKTPGFADAALPNGFTYLGDDDPSISGVVPETGPTSGGGLVLVQGSAFQPGSKVLFDNTQAKTIHVVGPQGIVVELPTGTAGVVDVRVQTPGASDAIYPNGFTYIAPTAPAALAVVPATGPVEGGIVVLVEGTGFLPSSEVWFGAVKAGTVFTQGPNSIGVELPPGSAGDVNVVVKTLGFDDTVLAGAFTYQELGPPSLAGVVPKKGSTEGGQIVLVQGANLRPQTNIWFGSTLAANVVSSGANAIALTLPAGVAGTVDVTAKTPGFADSVLQQSFTYEVPPPPPTQAMALAQVLPSTGPASGGGWAILKGLNLPSSAIVTFGDETADQVHVISKTTMTARVPAGQPGPVTVTVTDITNGQQAILPAGFIYYADGEATSPPPLLSSLKPAIGPSLGGTLALLSGQALQDGAYVFVDGKPATNVVVTGDEFASFRTPIGEPGAADVMLVNPDGGHATLAAAFVYTLADQPSIALTAVVPVQGTVAGGAEVTVVGTGFLPGTLVFMDGAPVKAVVNTSKNLTVTTPAHDPGLVAVQATAPDGFTAQLTGAYNFILEAPFVAGITPPYGKPAGGTDVTISGQGFHKTAIVSIGGAPCAVALATPTLITCKTPKGELGPVDVTVTNPDFLASTLADGFLYTNEIPGESVQIQAIVPNFGPMGGGSVSTISGSGFGAGSSVIVGSQVAPSVVLLSETTLLVTMPGGPIGAKNVQVIVPEVGSGTAQNAFFHFDPNSPDPFPVATNVLPTVGPDTGGTIARIDVMHASMNSKVYFGGVEAVVLGWDPTGYLVVKTAAHAPGLSDVVVMNANGKTSTMSGAFTFYTPGPNVQPPVLTQVSPGAGSTLGGEAISLTGAAFENGMLGFLGYRPIIDLSVSSKNGASGTTPANPAGLMDAAVTRLDGFSAVLKAAYGYDAPPPSIESIFPEVGHTEGGATVVLTGLAFQEGAQLFFGEAQATDVVVVASHLITATTPPQAVPGTVDLLVVNPDGKKGTLAAAYTYSDDAYDKPPPEVLALQPSQGPFQGGTVLAVYGKNFAPGAVVLFGGKPAQVHLVDEGLATVTTPPNFVGPVDVTVLNPDGQGASLTVAFNYISTNLPKPVLFGVTPKSGPESGGTSVILTGSQLTGGGLGFIGYRPLSSWTILNSAIAVGTTQVGTPGPQDVVATNGDGQSVILDNAFNYVGSPHIDSFQPTLGAVAGGKVVNIAGQNFDDAAVVTFGGKKALSIQVLSEFVIKCQTPAGDPGPAQVKVENPDGQAHVAAEPFLYVLPPELISSFPPQGSANGGTPVILTGLEFLDGASVNFGNAPATQVVVLSPTKATVVAPAGTIGETVAITLKNPDGQSAISAQAFTYVDPADIGPAPIPESLKPPTGPTTGGTWGMAFGQNLQDGAWAMIGAAPVDDFHVLGGSSARFVSAPFELTGAFDVTIINPDGGFGTLPDGFTYVDPATLDDAPDITALDPQSGPTKGGTVVIVTGSELSENTLVFFGKLPAAQIALDGLDVKATTPAHDLGKVFVTVTDDEGQSVHVEDGFEYVAPPIIVSLTPDKGPSGGGTFVTLSGANLVKGETVLKSSTVIVCEEWASQLNCVNADAVKVTDATELTFTTPALIPGFADVVVKNPDGQVAVAAQSFFYTPPPEIGGIVPASGTTLGGETVVITGTGFQPGATVTFGGNIVADIVVDSGTKIIVVTPKGAAGPSAVTVKNPDLTTHTVGGGFLYIRPPEIINVFPTLGPETGGTVVTIQGKGFVPGLGDEGSEVYFGNVKVPQVDLDVDSDTLITCKTPPGVGPVAVKIVNPDTQLDVLAGGFIYIPVIPPPEIKSLQPSFGGTAGGYLVNVVGKNFLAGAQVSFGNEAIGWVNGTEVKVKNAGTLIVVTAPGHPAGKVDVRVTNSDGQFGILDKGFEYAGPLQLPGLAFMGVSPDRGPAEGGYDVVVYGQGFKTGVKVYWGHETNADWMDSAKVTRLGPTLLLVTMPNYAKSEIVDVRIVNPVVGGEADEVTGSLAYTFGQSVVFEPKGQRLPNDVDRTDSVAVIFDANGDGMNDIMNLHANYRDELYINTKDADGNPGKFIDQTLTAMPTVPTAYTRGLANASDIDSDGDLDVVFRYHSNVGIYRNQGDGTFTFEQVGIGVSIASAYDLDLGDLNCDGVPDLFVTTDGPNYVAIGNGTGGFSVKNNVMPTHSEPSRSAALGDVDNDGDLDVLIANDNAFQNRLYYNNCNNTTLPPECTFDIPNCTAGTYGGHRYQFCNFGKAYWDVKTICAENGYGAATINSQEEQDFINTQTNYHTWIGYIDPDGDKVYEWEFGSSDFENWQPGQPNDTANNQCTIMNVSWAYKWDDQYCGSGYHFVCESNTLDVCPNPWKFTDATYGTNKNFPVSGFNSKTAILADIDGDTWLDAVMINQGQTNRIYFNNGGSFLNDDGLHYPQSESGKDAGGQLLDVDLDGDLDLLLSRYADNDSIWPELYLNDKAQGGAGIFVNATPVSIPEFRGEDSNFVAVGDLNADSLPDLYVVNRNHQDWMLINHGFQENKPNLDSNRVPIGAFANNTFYGMPELWTTVRNVAIEDIDDDGDLDIVMAAGDGGGAHVTRIWINDGEGNFFDETSTRLPEHGCNGQDIHMVDLNNDGDLDILLACYDPQYTRGGLRQLVNDGDGYFTHVSVPNLPGSIGTSGRYFSVSSGDIDGDGDLDIMFGAESWTWGVLVNGGDVFNNDGAFFLDYTSTIMPASHSVNERAIVITDLNGDGHLDVYVGQEGQQNQLWYNTGADNGKMQNVSSTHLPAINDATRWAVANDVDFDGDVDLFTFNNGDNRLFVGELDFKYSDVTVSHLPTGMAADSHGGDIGDLDGDGFVDILTANWGVQSQLLLNKGDAHFGDFTSSMPKDIDYNSCARFGDLDGDGDLDVFMCGSGVSRIYINKTPPPAAP